MKNLLAPFAAIVLVIAILFTATLELSKSNFSKETLSYFIKPVSPDRILVVEPNLNHFVKAGAIAEDAGESLRDALAEIAEKYEITASRIIHVERNIGSIVPNLLVYVQPGKIGEAIEAKTAEAERVIEAELMTTRD